MKLPSLDVSLRFAKPVSASFAILLLCCLGAHCQPATPDDAVERIENASSLLKEGKLNDAQQAAEQAIDANPSNYVAYAVAAKIASQQGNSKNTKQFLEKALALAPDTEKDKIRQLATMINSGAGTSSLDAPAKLSDEDQIKLDGLMLILDNADKAQNADDRRSAYRDFLTRSMEFAYAHPEQINIWLMRAFASVELDYPGEGFQAGHHLKTLKALGAIHSDDPKVHQVLTELDRKGWFGDQRTWRDWSKWSMDQVKEAANAGDLEAQVALGNWYEDGASGLKQDYSEALKWFQKAAMQDDLEAINAVAWTLAVCPDSAIRDGAEAVKMSARAVNMTQRNDPEIVDTLAAAYAETGEFEKASSAETEAMSKMPDGAMKNDFASRLALYQNRKPYHLPPLTVNTSTEDQLILPATQQLENTYGDGFGPYKFGMTPAQVANNAGININTDWSTLPVAAEYNGRDVRYFWVLLTKVPNLGPLNAGNFSAQSYICFLFENGNLFKVSFRFLNDAQHASYQEYFEKVAASLKITGSLSGNYSYFRTETSKVLFSGTCDASAAIFNIIKKGSPLANGD